MAGLPIRELREISRMVTRLIFSFHFKYFVMNELIQTFIAFDITDQIASVFITLSSVFLIAFVFRMFRKGTIRYVFGQAPLSSPRKA
ncbi:hypothetical protein BDD43_4381 [Mucilaginibacter gracilis]|uniref:Uncharacterized protein n=1 Tax=Mucilaginibacter gracilis TaxID=423350 RepID=A0A495J701_9SPHI|nr:hypothetical protein BDD43_4381 [Mucilaginibacter gracilis]